MVDLWAAPMVRISTLPFRLLCLEHGAARVFSPEIVDKALLDCVRIEADGVVSFVSAKGTSVFQTTPHEKSFLAVQLGSANADLALRAAQLIQDDVSEINLNCGCPKRFSVHAGMGAALLQDPDNLCHILTTLVAGLSVPVSAKIRLRNDFLEDPRPTIDLLLRIQATGIKHLIIHARRPVDRSDQPALWHVFDQLAAYQRIPWIANGDIFDREAALQCSRRFPCMSAVMMARGAMLNPSVFAEAPQDLAAISAQLVAYAIQYDSNFTMLKYALMQMWPDVHRHPQLLYARSLADLQAFAQAP